jgi:hypothetical protein
MSIKNSIANLRVRCNKDLTRPLGTLPIFREKGEGWGRVGRVELRDYRRAGIKVLLQSTLLFQT